MSTHFVYLWFDKCRKMFYVGQHSGSYDDNYLSSSRWLSGEIKYRPEDFTRKIIKTFATKKEAQIYEGYLLTLIKPHEFGKKYYNIKIGAPKGNKPWNAGKVGLYSEETKKKISQARKGKPTTKGKPNPQAANNARKGAKKLSEKVTGRKRLYHSDGSWTWQYPTTSVTEQVGTNL